MQQGERKSSESDVVGIAGGRAAAALLTAATLFSFSSVFEILQPVQAVAAKTRKYCTSEQFSEILVHIRNFAALIRHENKFSWSPDRCWRIRLDLK